LEKFVPQIEHFANLVHWTDDKEGKMKIFVSSS
jgi:hypothetical protein